MTKRRKELIDMVLNKILELIKNKGCMSIQIDGIVELKYDDIYWDDTTCALQMCVKKQFFNDVIKKHRIAYTNGIFCGKIIKFKHFLKIYTDEELTIFLLENV